MPRATSLRDVLVPINRKYPVNDLVEAAQAYGARTGRRVSYEWVMLAGVNDTERDARELGGLLKRKLAHVNLIPFNPVEDTPYHAPGPQGHPCLQRGWSRRRDSTSPFETRVVARPMRRADSSTSV